jgi:hypothetical protein
MNLVLNACGVDSLGGINLFKKSAEQLIENNIKLLILYSNEKQIYKINLNENVILKKINLKRHFHPFLNIFLDKKTKILINKYDAIIHYGNFGFFTDINSFVLIQNLLPFTSNSLKNKVLKFLINKSCKNAHKIIVQLPHVKNFINPKFSEKILEIGRVEVGQLAYENKKSILVFGSEVPNKNYKFIVKTFHALDNKKNLTIINPPNKIEEFNFEILSENNSLEDIMSKSSIYFHASDYETVGLPLYEASNAGLILVAPDLPYMKYFDKGNIFLYEHGNLDDAKRKLLDAINYRTNTVKTYTYKENWINLLNELY